MSESAPFIPLSVPSIKGREWEYVQECLRAEWVSSAGAFVDRFESEFAAYVGSKHAVACASGSAALHVGLLLAGVRRDDLVLVPTLTFIATVNSIRYCGADRSSDQGFNSRSFSASSLARRSAAWSPDRRCRAEC